MLDLATNVVFGGLGFLSVITLVVFVHELGHFSAGRLFGVKIESFSIGFGREILGFTDSYGTRWKIGWLPLGGYVTLPQLADMAAIEGETETDVATLPAPLTSAAAAGH